MTERQSPLMSIMISAYNQADVLRSAIDSALAQTYSPLEVIVSDDASTDNDMGALKEEYQDPRVRWFVQPKNLGRAGNYRSMLYDLAKGTYVTLLNGDDYFSDDTYIASAVSILEDNPEVSVVFGEVSKLILNTGKIIEDTFHSSIESLIIDGNKYLMDYPDKGYSIPHATSVYRRQEAIDLEFYRINFMSQDLESFMRLIMDRKLAIINETVAIKRQHPGNVGKMKEMDRFEQNEYWLNSIYKHGIEHSSIPKAELDTWLFKMKKRHHQKWLIKMEYLAPDQIPNYIEFLKKENKEVWDSIRNDLKYMAFKLLKNSDFIMRLIFKYIIKQESFIVDLQDHQKENQS